MTSSSAVIVASRMNGQARIRNLLTTLPRLGLRNLLRVTTYRLLVRCGVIRRLLPPGEAYRGPFLAAGAAIPTPGGAEDPAAERVLCGWLPFYGHQWRETGFPPRWSADVWPLDHWSQLNEFGAGDVKDAWEPSRFAGLQILASAAARTRNPRYAEACNIWLTAWVAANPLNLGINWKCAQEAALRLLSATLSVELLASSGIRYPTPAFLRFIREHARRIIPTISYAQSQDNNHATSEATALYVAGAFLRHLGKENAESRRWLRIGRRLIEAHLHRLVMPDGSFAQHSVTYHRLMLDTLVMAEWWRRRVGDASWSPAAWNRLARAVEWLESLVNFYDGDAPNLGANDGARFFACDPAPYRDFRTSLDLGARLFCGRRAMVQLPDDAVAGLLGLGGIGASQIAATNSGLRIFPDGGYAVWAFPRGRLVLRLPVFHFRPAHCDILHIDLWWQGENLLRDGGSYSYNSKPDRSGYFAGVASHNTIQFDGRDQMPRLGRFLWGCWPCGEWHCEPGGVLVASYRDWMGAQHRRRVQVSNDTLLIDDEVSGFIDEARLRWRLPPDNHNIDISIDGSDEPPFLVPGEESRHYHNSTPVRVFEALRRTPGRFTTRIRLNSVTIS